MNVLVLNAGSSSLRFQLIDTDPERIPSDEDRLLARGRVERIGSLALIDLETEGRARVKREASLKDHRAAIDLVLRWLVGPESHVDAIRSLGDIHAVGHRVVHGGSLRESVRIDDEVLATIQDQIELAPLHNPANLEGIAAARELLGDAVPQVAVFDTAFHSTLPETSYLYAIPYHYYRRFKVRRYGFHGTSHRYLADRYARVAKKEKQDVHIITLHLGNGCSACAIRAGESVDTSMGFTPLEGLVMGTRSGDIDPSLLEYLSYKEGLSFDQLDVMLNKQSGLLGVSGLTGDMRELLEEIAATGDRRAELAVDLFCERVKKYIGAYFVELGGADAVVFSGGIGANSPQVRERIASGLGCLGLVLDEQANARVAGSTERISTADSSLAAYVIPTDEELMIARDTVRLLAAAPLPRPTPARSKQ